MLFAVSEATVPKISVMMRKSYGAGYFVMNGYAYEPDYIVAWPTAEIAVMGPDGAVNIIHRRTLEAVPEEDRPSGGWSSRRTVRRNIDPFIAAGHALIDDVIDPAETRAAIWRGLEVASRQADCSSVAEARCHARLDKPRGANLPACTRSAPRSPQTSGKSSSTRARWSPKATRS